jgi:hypothetical protein
MTKQINNQPSKYHAVSGGTAHHRVELRGDENARPAISPRSKHGLKSNRLDLQKRISCLEEIAGKDINQRPKDGCNCREITYYHIPDELQAILDNEAGVPCPVHRTRNLGRLKWLWQYSQSLLPADRKYCCCPPNSERDFAEGKRLDVPTKADEEADFDRAVQYYGHSEVKFQEDQRRAESMTSAYYAKLSTLLGQVCPSQHRQKVGDPHAKVTG